MRSRLLGGSHSQTNSQAYPLSAESGKLLLAFAPKTEHAAGSIGPAIEKAVREGSQTTKHESGNSLKSVDDLVEKVR